MNKTNDMVIIAIKKKRFILQNIFVYLQNY